MYKSVNKKREEYMYLATYFNQITLHLYCRFITYYVLI